METIIGVTELRQRTKEIVAELGDRPVIIVRSSKPVAVLMRPDTWQRTLDRIEDLEDQLTIARAAGDTIALDVARKEILGDD
ncbi:MAG: type II toxin-antitoxin system Phd/YefM family antitoxin [Acidimicrobiia bacterium]